MLIFPLGRRSENKMEQAKLVWTLLALQMIGQNRPVLTQTESYTHNIFLDANEKYQVFWKFDEENISFEVHVETNGYVGLGFSPTGKMLHSDCVIGWIKDGETFLQDRYAAQDESEPLIDAKNDLELIFSRENGTHTILAFSRKRKTCDPQDRRLDDGTVRVIWSFHNDDPESESDSLSYHATNRGSKSIFLFDPPAVVPSLPENLTSHQFLNSNVSVPNHQHTTYWCQAFKMPDLGGQKHHIVKTEPIIQRGHESLVHHFLVFECHHDVNESYHGYGSECNHANMPDDLENCNRLIVGWAIGGEEFYFPENVGYPIGGEDSPKIILLETHYDNPTYRDDYVDSSGLRIFYTNELREIDAGILMAGVGVGQNQVIPPGSSEFVSTGYCPQVCMSQNLNGSEEIEVFSIVLHTHLAGSAISARLFREGEEHALIAQDNSYDFNFQETRYLPDTITITPSDTIVVGCKYDVRERNEVTYGGDSTVEEMCLVFIYYYPRKPMTQCLSFMVPQGNLKAVVGDPVDGSYNQEGTFVIHTPEEYENITYNQLLEGTEWTDELRKALEKAQTTDAGFAICDLSDNPFYFFQPFNVGNLFNEETPSECTEPVVPISTTAQPEMASGVNPFSCNSVYFYSVILAVAFWFQ